MTSPLSATASQPDALAALVSLLGAEQVQTTPEKRVFFSTDMDRTGGLPLAVIRPRTSAELADAARLLHDFGIAMVPRGGGFSYTGGYVPEQGGG